MAGGFSCFSFHVSRNSCKGLGWLLHELLLCACLAMTLTGGLVCLLTRAVPCTAILFT
jgi:hypothetical protein